MAADAAGTIAVTITTAETAAAVTSRSALVRDRNRRVQDLSRHPVPVRIPVLSRDLLTGTVLPAAVKRKGTDFRYPWIVKEGETAYRSLLLLQRDDSLTGEGSGAILDKE